MKLTIYRLVTVFLGLVLFAGVSGCSSDSGGDPPAPPVNPKSGLNGTFVGYITVSRGSGSSTGTKIQLTLSVSSPLSGTFITQDGASGTLSGEASGDSATFEGVSDETRCFRDSITGTFKGTSTEKGKVVIHCNGKWWFKATVFFEGSVDGKEGTLEMLAVGTRPGAGTEWVGKSTIIRGTGELANLRGQFEWWGLGAPAPKEWGYIFYEGNFHFKP